MGTLVRITLYAPDEQAARDAFRAAFDRIRNLDRILSDYRPDSELNQITKAAVGRAVRVSEDLFAVLAASQDWRRRPAARSMSRRGPSSGSGARLGRPRACPIQPRSRTRPAAAASASSTSTPSIGP